MWHGINDWDDFILIGGAAGGMLALFCMGIYLAYSISRNSY
jgi:hypothetical protein